MNQKYQLFNLMMHVMQNTEYTPKWNYQKEPFLEADTLHDLPFRHCLFPGISKSSCQRLFHSFADREDYNLHGMLIVQDGQVIFEEYVPPYKKQYRHVTYSMCKSVAGMAVGLAMDDNKLTMSTRLSEIFPEYIGAKASKELKSLNIYHLLTMQAGVRFHELSQAFCRDWVKSYLKSDFIFTPGEGFYYNSMNSYILCALLQKIYKEPVTQLLQRRIFDPLEIHDVTWDTCPMGIEKGGYGMKLSLHDMAKLGMLYLNHGIHTDSQTGRKHHLLSDAYISAATSVQVTTKNPGFDYGYHCWVMEDGFLFNGMLGQNVYVFPEKKLVIATQGGGECFLPGDEMMSAIRAFVYPSRKKSIINSEKSAVIGCRAFHFKTEKENRKNIEKLFMSQYVGNTYRLIDAIPSVMPFFMQLFYQQVAPGIEQISLYHKYPDTRKTPDSGPFLINFQSGEEVVTLEAACGQRIEQHVLIHGQCYPLCVSCNITTSDSHIKEKIEAQFPQLKTEDAEKTVFSMALRIDYLEEANARILEIIFDSQCIHIKTRELPSLEYLSDSLLRKEVLTIDAPKIPKHLPANIQEKINKMLKPDTYGFEI